jgi:NAD(P)H dehydrogenase (quinone)
VASIEATEPIAYRYQNHGEYDDHLVLRPEHHPESTGLAVHYVGLQDGGLRSA